MKIFQHVSDIGVRSFARFESREDDYEEKILNDIRESIEPTL